MTNFALAECNPDHPRENGILRYILSERAYTPLSSYLNIAVPRLLESDADLRLFSTRMEQLLDTPELIYEFDGSIHNVLRVCDFTKLKSQRTALDLSQDFGGTSEFLSTLFSHVDSIKVDPLRTKLSRQRFPESRNIHFHTATPEKLSYPKKQYDFIYLGRVEDLELDTASTESLLGKLRDSLSSNGVLVVNIKNRDRMSKWLNTDRDNLDPLTPYKDLYADEHSNLFSADEFSCCLSKLDFGGILMGGCFSAHHGLPNLLSQDYLDNSPTALNHFYRIGSINNPKINEYLLYKSLLVANKNLFHKSSRIVAFCDLDNSSAERLYGKDFCHFPGTNRLPKWRTITSKDRSELKVVKTPIMRATVKKRMSQPELLKQDIAEQNFAEGRILIDAWLEAVLAKNAKSLSQLIQTYFRWLQSRADPINKKILSSDTYDLLPFNILCENNNFLDLDCYRAIDPEWLIQKEISPEFILFRALFWFAFENKSLLADFGDTWGFQTIDAFIRHYLNEVSSDENLLDFVHLEETVQREISDRFKSGSILHSLHGRFTGEINEKISHNVCQITWADQQNIFDNARTLNIDWPIKSNLQTLKHDFSYVDTKKSILRIDPMQRPGLFKIAGIALLDKEEKTIWQIRDAKQLADLSQMQNIELSTTDSEIFFIATNEDPFFLIDLSNQQQLEQISEIQIELELIFDPSYNQALKSLLDLVDSQAESIVRLGNKGHETQADIDMLKSRLNQATNSLIHQSNQLKEFDEVTLENQRLRQALTLARRSFLQRVKDRLIRLFGFV